MSGRLLTLLAASAICLLAWALFLSHLHDTSMWLDEHQTWRLSRGGPVFLVHDTIRDVHPPLGNLWVWLWMSWTGSSDQLFVMRLSSVLMSMLTVAFIYRTGKDRFRSDLAGAGAALFLLSSGIFVFYSRILRMYAPIVLLALLSWLLLQRLLENKSRGVWGYAAALALMAYTHYTSVFIVGAQLIFVLVFYRQHLRRLFWAFALALIAFLPWIPPFLQQLEVNRSQKLVESALLAGPAPGQITSLNHISKFWAVFSNQQTAFVLLLVVLALTLGLRAVPALRARRWLLAAAIWFFLTMILVFSFSLIIPVYRERFVLMVLPGLALLVGAAVSYLPQGWPRLGTVGVIALAGLLSHAQVFDLLPIIPPHRDLLAAVAERFYPGDRIWYNLTFGARGSSIDLEAEYHLIYDTPQLHSDDFIWRAPREFDEAGESPRVWDLRPYWIPILDDVWPALEAGRFITEEYSINSYTIRLYEAPPLDQAAYRFGDWFDLVLSPLPPQPYGPGDTLRVTTWWRAQRPVPRDYSYGLFLRNSAQQYIAQADASLTLDERPSSQWTPQGDYAPLSLSLSLPPDLPPGEYELLLGVYYWEDGLRLPITSDDSSQIEAALDLLRIAPVAIE